MAIDEMKKFAVDSPFLSPNHLSLECRRGQLEVLKLATHKLEVSRDNGHTWEELPWKGSLYVRLGQFVGSFDWPPILDCFGWRAGEIAIGWHSKGDDEANIGKFIGTFDKDRGIWRMEYLGMFNLAQLLSWYENVGFEVLTATMPGSIDWSNR